MMWLAFFTGVLIGTFVGVFALGLCVIAKRSQADQEQWEEGHNERARVV